MPHRILTIDDDPETTGALRRILEHHGYEVREENDSRRALETARDFRPDVLILDYSMPGWHGGDVAWSFANDSLLATVKVIFCSGLSETIVRSKLPPAGMAILTKPVAAEELLSLLQQSGGMTALNFRRPVAASTHPPDDLE